MGIAYIYVEFSSVSAVWLYPYFFYSKSKPLKQRCFKIRDSLCLSNDTEKLVKLEKVPPGELHALIPLQ